jgi:D-aminopeptidase
MVSFGFKAGIGTASRVVELGGEPFVLGVLVQANFGRRPRFTVAGVPVGRAIPESIVPLPSTDVPASPPGPGPVEGAGSVIAIVATNAPLLPGQCERLAQRAALGIGRNGPFAAPAYGAVTPATTSLRMVVDHHLDPLFHATIEATEEAVLNALLAAPTMTGRDGVTAHALPVELLLGALARG